MGKKQETIFIASVEFKKCVGSESCGELKELNNNNFELRSPNSWRPKCRKCLADYQKKYRANNKEKIAAKDKQRHKIGYIKHKEQISAKGKEYRKNNKEKIAAKNKIYSRNNKDKIGKNSKRHYEKNKDKIRAREKERKKEDLAFNMRKTVSYAVNASLKKQGTTKNGRSISEFLDIDKIAAHLQSLYDFWMTDKNKGPYNSKTWDDGDPSTWKWNIDHITPQSDLLFTEMSHDPESNFQKCWALSNIRPLSAKQNIIDGASRVRHKKKAA
jgi:hypothetical protein